MSASIIQQPGVGHGRLQRHGGPQRHKRLSRPFTILDAMTLVAASAVGFMNVRFYTTGLLEFELIMRSTVPRLCLTVYLYLLAALPLPLVWSLAGFLLGLRRPRPSYRRLIRQPGFIACVAVSLVITIRVTGFLTLLLRTALKNLTLLNLDSYEAFTIPFTRLSKGPILTFAAYAGPFFSTTAFGASAAVASAWLLLYASGRWRSEANWLDRMGRLLGWFWIVIIPFSCWWDYNVLE